MTKKASKENLHVVVMIPALNEQDSIGQVISSIPKDWARKVEILVVDDGSTDLTSKVAMENGADKIVSHKSNRGLGIAFKTGLEVALKMGADIIVNIDADGQFNPLDIPKLVHPIIKSSADVTTCTRFSNKELVPRMPLIKKVGNRFFTSFINLLTRSKFTDTLCGFRAYSREAALRLNIHSSFTYTQEVFLDLIEKNMIIEEVPLKVKGVRTHGKSKIVLNPFHYGFNSLIIILKSFRDHHPIKFFGNISFLFILVGLIMGFFLFTDNVPEFIKWITPFQSLLFTIIGFILFVLAMFADMNQRNKKTNDEILYLLKRREYD